MSCPFHVVVRQLPLWLDWQRLLGPGDWRLAAESGSTVAREADLTRQQAADLAARLRGVGIGGALLEVEISPPLQRKDLRKAYADEARRYRDGSVGFSRRGTRVDAEGKMSLTPEAIALQLGQRVRGQRVIDACAGAGGNAIGFARAGCVVTAIELDPQRLAMARHNAAIYGVAERMEFMAGDARVLVPQLEADLLFIDPPWGGSYNKQRTLLADLPPAAGLLAVAAHIERKWIKAPPSIDPASIPHAHPEAYFGTGSGDERRVKFVLLEA